MESTKTATPEEHRAAFVAGLRSMADALEQRASMPLPTWPTLSLYRHDRGAWTETAAAIGATRVEDRPSVGSVGAIRDFGPLRFEVQIDRHRVISDKPRGPLVDTRDLQAAIAVAAHDQGVEQFADDVALPRGRVMSLGTLLALIAVGFIACGVAGTAIGWICAKEKYAGKQ